MSGPLPSGRCLELPMEPGEMPGMPQPHLASCNWKPAGQFHFKHPRIVEQHITKSEDRMYNKIQTHGQCNKMNKRGKGGIWGLAFSGQWGGMLGWTEKSLQCWLELGQQQQEVEAQTVKVKLCRTSKQQQTVCRHRQINYSKLIFPLVLPHTMKGKSV